MADSDDKKDDPRTIQQTMREAWLSVLGVFSSAEAEVQKATHKLFEAIGVPEGGDIREELMARMRKNREEFERRIDEGVKSAVAKVRAPIDKEIATLKSRVEKLQARIEERKKNRKKKE